MYEHPRLPDPVPLRCRLIIKAMTDTSKIVMMKRRTRLIGGVVWDGDFVGDVSMSQWDRFASAPVATAWIAIASIPAW